MKFTLKAMTVPALLLCALLCGCSRRSAAYTAEAYYTYEDQFRSAGYTKRTAVMYVAQSDQSFQTSDELKEAVGTPETSAVVEWEGSDNKCTSYNLSGTDETRIGAVTYTYRYADSKERIAKIGGGYYTEYTYKDKKIQMIARYSGEKKTADSQAVMTTEFKYDSEGNNTVISVNDQTGEAPLSYDCKLTYDEKGRLISIIYVDDVGNEESHTDFVYNGKGLIASASRYGKDGQLLVYTEYSYE